MAFVPIKMNPGVDVVSTPLLAETKWVSTTNCRFFQGKVQQDGFFQRLTSATPIGICRCLMPWQDTSGLQYIGVGTNEELAVLNNGVLYNITPVAETTNLTAAFSTTNGSPTVTIADSSDNAAVGNYIYLNTTVSVGGLILQGFYAIKTIGSNNFTITAASNATSTVTNGGTTSEFTTTNGNSTVKVTLANHGLIAGSLYTVHVSTAVGGQTLFGQYIVQSVIDANNFDISTGINSTSSTSAYENSDEAQVQYLLPSGLASNGGIAGYGQLPYGIGPYGLGYQDSYLPLRQWSMGQWGSYLIASPTDLGVYVWMPSGGFYSNPATLITQAPAYNTQIFIATSQQQVVALGAQDSVSGVQDPMLVRWCDVADYTDWTATTTNQAGSFRIPIGSKLVGGIWTTAQNLIWTDLGLWSMAYISTPYIYSFNQIATGCGLIARRAFCSMAGNVVAWMSQRGFFLYSGGTVVPITCPVWDIIFKNLNQLQLDKITCAANSSFNEIAWHFPSASGSGEVDSVVRVNLVDGSWDYNIGGNAQIYVRTAWYDQSIFGPPIGSDLNGLIQQAETGTSADGNSIVSSARTAWFKLEDGLDRIYIERLLPDFVFTGQPALTLSVFAVNYPGDTPYQLGPIAAISNGVQQEYVITRGRARLLAIQIDCVSGQGAFWRHGEILAKVAKAGRR